MSKENLQFWRVTWFSQKCSGGDSCQHFSVYDEMLELFKRLSSDVGWDYSISVYEFNVRFDQEAIVEFIDHFSRNEIAGDDISSLVRYEVDVIGGLRHMIERTNAHVAWEQELDGLCEAGSALSVTDLERAFLIDRPILFLGSVREIEPLASGDVQIAVRPHSILPSNHAVRINLEVRLSVPKEAALSFMEKISRLDGSLDEALDVAVAAQVNGIERVDERDESAFDYRTVLRCTSAELDPMGKLTLHEQIRERILDRLQKH